MQITFKFSVILTVVVCSHVHIMQNQNCNLSAAWPWCVLGVATPAFTPQETYNTYLPASATLHLLQGVLCPFG